MPMFSSRHYLVIAIRDTGGMHRFDPDRFTPGIETRNRFAYLPFGLGPRACIGLSISL